MFKLETTKQSSEKSRKISTKKGKQNEHRNSTSDYPGIGVGWGHSSVAAQPWLGIWSQWRRRLDTVDRIDLIRTWQNITAVFYRAEYGAYNRSN